MGPPSCQIVIRLHNGSCTGCIVLAGLHTVHLDYLLQRFAALLAVLLRVFVASFCAGYVDERIIIFIFELRRAKIFNGLCSLKPEEKPLIVLCQSLFLLYLLLLLISLRIARLLLTAPYCTRISSAAIIFV